MYFSFEKDLSTDVTVAVNDKNIIKAVQTSGPYSYSYMYAPECLLTYLNQLPYMSMTIMSKYSMDNIYNHRILLTINLWRYFYDNNVVPTVYPLFLIRPPIYSLGLHPCVALFYSFIQNINFASWESVKARRNLGPTPVLWMGLGHFPRTFLPGEKCKQRRWNRSWNNKPICLK